LRAFSSLPKKHPLEEQRQKTLEADSTWGRSSRGFYHDTQKGKSKAEGGRMEDEGGRMKRMLFKAEPYIFNSSSFILHPSAFILAS
jgi:hypothetical protein